MKTQKRKIALVEHCPVELVRPRYRLPCEKAKGHKGKHMHLICELAQWDNKGNVTGINGIEEI